MRYRRERVLGRTSANVCAASPLGPLTRLARAPTTRHFWTFAGIASLNLGYGGEPGGGIYHSAYDDFYWYTHFDDPTFVYGRALAQTAGTAVMRLADADLLPFNFSDLYSTVRNYVSDIEKLAETQGNQIRERNREIAEGFFAATSDPAKPPVPPRRSRAAASEFCAAGGRARSLNRSADHYQRAGCAPRNPRRRRLAQLADKVNEELLRTERALTDPNGLPGRPWYKHQLYAPGFYTGYGVKTIPAGARSHRAKAMGSGGTIDSNRG